MLLASTWASSWTSPLSPRPRWLVDLLVGLHKVNHKVNHRKSVIDALKLSRFLVFIIFLFFYLCIKLTVIYSGELIHYILGPVALLYL